MRLFLAVLLMSACAGVAGAETWALSPDGSAVVRLKPQGTVGASSFDTSLLVGGYSGAIGAVGSTVVNRYDADFDGLSGGARFRATYSNAAPLAAGQRLDWLQVVNQNVPIGSQGPIVLDNGDSLVSPLYDYTSAYQHLGQPSTTTYFGDFSRRSVNDLSKANPITWDAALYPVIVDGKTLTIGDGVTWGWETKKAPVGDVSAVFTAASPGVPAVDGLGTSSLAWASGHDTLNFAGNHFDTAPATPFSVGQLTFQNDSGQLNDSPSIVNFNASFHFTNIPEKNFDLSSLFHILDVPTDPQSHDAVPLFGKIITLGDYAFSFSVSPGQTKTVDLWATLTTDLSGSPAGGTTSGSLDDGDLAPSPNYVLTFAGFGDPSGGGTTNGVPEPATWGLMLFGFLILGTKLRARRAVCIQS